MTYVFFKTSKEGEVDELRFFCDQNNIQDVYPKLLELGIVEPEVLLECNDSDLTELIQEMKLPISRKLN